MILCAEKVIYGIFGFKWVLHQLNLQILKSSFRSSSLTHNPYCSIYKYKFGTDNRPCKFQGLYLHIYVEGPLCKWIEVSPAKNSRHRWSCLSTNGSEPRMRNGAAYLEDGFIQQKKSSPVTWVMSCSRHLQEGILGTEFHLAVSQDQALPRMCGTRQRTLVLVVLPREAAFFLKWCSIFLYAYLHQYRWCPCLIYTRAPHSGQVRVRAPSHRWCSTYPSSMLAAKGKQGAHALTDTGDSVLPASPWWCRGQVYGSALRVEISDLQRVFMISISLPWQIVT